jgi:hypothetical protein
MPDKRRRLGARDPRSRAGGLRNEGNENTFGLATHIADKNNPHEVLHSQLIDVGHDDINPHGNNRWQGEWIQQQYVENDQVLDQGWLMIANKDTEDRAAPQPFGLPAWLLPTDPAWTPQSYLGTVYTGVEVIPPADSIFAITQVRAWLPDVTANAYYRVIVYDVNKDSFEFGQQFQGTILPSPGWLEVTAPGGLITDQDRFIVLLESYNSAATTDFNHPWVYTGTSQQGDPGLGNWNRDNQQTILRIDYEDDDGTDRQTELGTVVPGTLIRCEDEADSTVYWRYRVDDETDVGGYFQYGVTYLGAGPGGGPTALTRCQIYFQVPVPLSTDYVELPNEYVDTPNLSGYIAFDEITNTPYAPGAMLYDGASYYQKSNITTTGNKVTGVLTFKIDSFTGNDFYYLCRIASIGPDRERLVVVAWSSDYADADLAGRVSVWTRDSANNLICYLHSPVGYLDGQVHTLFYSFDGDAGTAVYRIDENDADDIANADRIAPTIGTLGTGATSQMGLGASNTGTKFVNGELGYFGYGEVYLTNYTDFIDPNGYPKELDETGWTEWGGQPLFWNDAGDMEANLGSAGNMTKNGTITPVAAINEDAYGIDLKYQEYVGSDDWDPQAYSGNGGASGGTSGRTEPFTAQYEVIGATFRSRFTLTERENWAKLNNRFVYGAMGIPPWDDVFTGQILMAYISARIVDIRDPTVFLGIHWLESIGVIGPGRADIILTP